ncbi:hypothetical protein EJ08DRAFT_514567 [Tothia fuscella]|uniref:Uncharacterized protein n=1 Tax=Tothia fuscella TaxID=1048955 RepID=A0A9P4NHH9_9PEZI|nr:hypothetical protein EJ08DRAFT_514567 [Tothia fuscella]
MGGKHQFPQFGELPVKRQLRALQVALYSSKMTLEIRYTSTLHRRLTTRFEWKTNTKLHIAKYWAGKKITPRQIRCSTGGLHEHATFKAISLHFLKLSYLSISLPETDIQCNPSTAFNGLTLENGVSVTITPPHNVTRTQPIILRRWGESIMSSPSSYP